jgi:hypothetical protein
MQESSWTDKEARSQNKNSGSLRIKKGVEVKNRLCAFFMAYFSSLIGSTWSFSPEVSRVRTIIILLNPNMNRALVLESAIFNF